MNISSPVRRPCVVALLVVALACDSTAPRLPTAIEVANEAPGTVARVSVWDFKTARYVYAVDFPYGARSCGLLDNPTDGISYGPIDTMRLDIVVQSDSGAQQTIVLGPFSPFPVFGPQAWKVVVRADMTASLTPQDHWPC